MTAPPTAPRVFAVVPAAGRGERFGAELPKQYAPLLGATVLEWSLRALLREPRIEAIAVPLTAGDARGRALIERLNDSRLRATVGGLSRHESVRKGLDALESLAGPDDWILVHDAARPCLGAADVAALIDALEPVEGAPVPSGAMLAAPIFDTVKRERDGNAVATVDRRGLWRALTPQIFGFAPLKRALDHASASQVVVTDEAQAMEALGSHPRLVEGSAFNIKVTRPDDLAAAARILKHAEGIGMRVGQGFDVHTFGEGDHVMLGGVRIAHHRGVVAHSDGDVVIHALCDAVLGALGQGDIGRHFPDTDPQYRGADSRTFLRHVAQSMRSAGYALVNADLTVLAEAPRIAPHRAAMAENLAADLGVSPERINVKATTTERLGFVGRGEGLAASAAVLLEG